jgi:hypothetical protein
MSRQKLWFWIDLTIYLVPNVNFFPCCNGCIIYKKLKIVWKLWVNKLTYVINWLHKLLFMKAKLLKVILSFTKPNTCNIVIFATFGYSFNLWTKSGKDWICNHIQMTKFTFVDICFVTFDILSGGFVYLTVKTL